MIAPRIRKAVLACLTAVSLLSSIAAAFAQLPPPVPALPDVERRTSYSISSSLCSCNIGFQLYADSTDVVNWLEVFVNGVLIPQSGGWNITSPSNPSGLANAARPITDAVLTFTAAQTGTVQIVGARRPRRTSQFQESQPVPTRNFNQTFSDIIATQRELWDKTNDFTGRGVFARPGETLALLPLLANRQNMGACFDNGGNLTSCVSVPSSTHTAGNGILFTGVNPTVISNNIAAGNGIAITGTSLLTIATGPGTDANIATTKTTNYTAANGDCGAPLLLGGNAQFTLTVNAANTYTTNCHLIVINTDAYTGPGSGRGKVMAISGITQHTLYPGQKLDLRQNGSAWAPDQQLSGSFGQVWNAPSAVTFFVDTGGSNTASDGLASGAAGSFLTLAKCATQAYSVVYTRNLGSIVCSHTAAQNTSEFLTIFYPLTGGGTLLFNSATPGVQWTWTCPINIYCLQFGDDALVGATDTIFTTNPSSLAVIAGHNYGVFDGNTNLTFNTGLGQPIFTCDYDTHFNINNGFTYTNAASFLFQGCQGSRWNINGAINSSGTVVLNRLFNFLSGSLATFQGNVTWGTTGLSTSAGLVTGNSVLNNFSGALPGGAPTPSTGGQYCTSPC